MALAVGARIGSYDILSPLGSGGMGVVYRARDTKLGRDVALKVLPASLANDPDRLARLGREARVLAALNHPCIATIHGLEEADGIRAIVMELVDGPTLAEKLAANSRLGTVKGLPVPEALEIAAQVADALDSAHEKGIVHRDLKPANLKFTRDGQTKVLDFGLAKAFSIEHAGAGPFDATTMTGDPFNSAVAGTPAYMSPEQARGEPPDKRTDIWAFGCVLFEMLAGRAAFGGQTISDTIASVLQREPDWDVLPPSTPAKVRHLLARCLEKDLKRRWRDIGDVRMQIGDAQKQGPDSGAHAGTTRVRERIAWSLVLLAAIGAALVVGGLWRTAAAPAEIRFDVPFPRDMASDFSQLAVSPDGRQIVAAPSFASRQPLWLRPLDTTTGRTLPGTEGATFPFWSPDGDSIAFFADNKLKRISVDGLAVQELAAARNARAGAWLPDGTILYAPDATGPLFRVAATGGQPTIATHLLPGQNDHRSPFPLPGGRHFLYFSRGAPQVRGVWVARLDGSEPKRLLDADAAAVYASGHLLFARQSELFAEPFDMTRLTTTGGAIRIADRIAVNPGLSLASLSASASHAIVYGAGAFRHTQLAWFDRSGKRLDEIGPNDLNSLANPALSPDGSQVAFSRVVGGNWDIWLADMHAALRRFTSSIALEFNPVWSQDGRQIVFQSANSKLNVQSVDDATPDRTVLSGVPEMQYPTDISPDGRFLLYTRSTTGPDHSSVDLWYLSLSGDPAPRPFLQTAFNERDGQFSPDGNWVAYQSDESGHFEIYLRPFPGPGERVKVSDGPGQQVRWGHRGSELFFIGPDQRLVSAPAVFGAGGSLSLGKPTPLFRIPFDAGFLTRQQYSVGRDDQRFLVNAITDAAEPSSMTVILNWKGGSVK